MTDRAREAGSADGRGRPATTFRPHDRVILLDRDGTVVIDREYLADPDGLEFLPGAAEGLCRLHQRGHRLVIISNQSGVGRGLLSLGQLQAIETRLNEMVRSAGAELTGIYSCPHRPDEDCECRKPRTRLVEEAARELGFDPRAAIVIGDKASDIELGHRIGALTILVAPADRSRPASTSADPRPDYVVADLTQAARLIEQVC